MSHQVGFAPLGPALQGGHSATVQPVRAHSRAAVEPCAAAKSHRGARGGLSSCPCHPWSSGSLGRTVQRGDPAGDPKMNLLAQVSSLLRTLQAPDWLFLQPWHWLGSWVSSSRQAVTGAVTTAGFFLCEGLLGQHFNVVPNGVAEPQPGDLFLFPLASGSPGWWGAHAGIYCGDGEIIHLEGIVAKHGKSHLLRARGPARVLRRKAGLDVAALQRRVRAAMDQPLEYDTLTCNCIHFALALLGLGHLAGAMVSPALQ
ncbi:uncharacterized protein LOC120509059 isoform X2 [Passer montanus]|uniref:uncharacterized protein LOC120509059 isoform X2 n=1 Tax=Passer montanus TaxID=9160 RepID=UPI00196063C8|nr:uncharacterized protein LOC120509059 isoform X2 [Passer montanus]